MLDIEVPGLRPGGYGLVEARPHPHHLIIREAEVCRKLVHQGTLKPGLGLRHVEIVVSNPNPWREGRLTCRHSQSPSSDEIQIAEITRDILVDTFGFGVASTGSNNKRQPCQSHQQPRRLGSMSEHISSVG